MTRPKVADDKRKRIGTACDECKHRKQKCNGKQPCEACDKRDHECIYTPSASKRIRSKSGERVQSPSKQPRVDHLPLHGAQVATDDALIKKEEEEVDGDGDEYDESPATTPGYGNSRRLSRIVEGEMSLYPSDSSRTLSLSMSAESPALVQSATLSPTSSLSGPFARLSTTSAPPAAPTPLITAGLPLNLASSTSPCDRSSAVSWYQNTDTSHTDTTSPKSPRNRTQSPDSAECKSKPFNSSRFLTDNRGNVLYFGVSSVLSLLPATRIIVQKTIGPTDFTDFEQQTFVVEHEIELSKLFKPTRDLPDLLTRQILFNIYKTQTSGLMEILDTERLQRAMYSPTGTITDPDRCLLFLVFAIGWAVVAPADLADIAPADRERLRGADTRKAEAFFRNAEDIAGPNFGLKNSGLWSVQALALMALYMLCVSRRDAAYMYCGMAIRSAYSLCVHVHIGDVHVYKVNKWQMNGLRTITHNPSAMERRNLWRSLFVLDHFLAASLGRPLTISEESISRQALLLDPIPKWVTKDDELDEEMKDENSDDPNIREPYPEHLDQDLHTKAMTAAIIDSICLRDILRMYAKNDFSSSITNNISKALKDSETMLDADLPRKPLRVPDRPMNQTIAIIHAHLLHQHSVILLTQPFLFDWMYKRVENDPCPQTFSKLVERCVNSCYNTINLVQELKELGYLPKWNPFVLHFLFNASLLIQCNAFFNLLDLEAHGGYLGYKSAIQKVTAILRYCSAYDISPATGELGDDSGGSYCDGNPQARKFLAIIEDFHEDVRKCYGVLPNLARPADTTMSGEGNVSHMGAHEDVQTAALLQGQGSYAAAALGTFLSNGSPSNSNSMYVAANTAGVYPAQLHYIPDLPPVIVTSPAGGEGSQSNSGDSNSTTMEADQHVSIQYFNGL